MTESREERLERLLPMFQARVDAQDAEYPGYGKEWARFAGILLRHGGVAVVPPGSPDPMLGVFANEAEVCSPQTVETVQGTASDCHANAVALWRSGKIVALGTGYGLNGDLWREHSWGWKSRDRLVETTETRECYFGVRLEGDRAQWFADWIDPSRP